MEKIKVYFELPGASHHGGDADGPAETKAPENEKLDVRAPVQDAKKAEKIALAKSQAAALRDAAKSGAAFCEECERAKKDLAGK